MMVDNVYVLDNGAHTAKVELSKASAPRIIPNCIMKAKSERRRPFIGDQVEECRDASGLFYLLPFQKGFLINWDVQKTVWDYIFSKECCYGNFAETPLIVTEPYFNFPSIQEAMSEIFFEEYECQSLLRINVNCELKEELEGLIEVLQLRDASADILVFVGNSSFALRCLSQIFSNQDWKTILWQQNRNPLLNDNLYTGSFQTQINSRKQLWKRDAFNLPDKQLLLKLTLVPTLHCYFHEKQRLLSKLAEFCDLIELGNNHKSETEGQKGQIIESDNISHKISKEKCNSLTFIEKIARDNLCDSNDQPVNYSLKYFEYENPPMLDNCEQPVDFSLKYLEEMEAEMMFGAGETCYAEAEMSQQPEDIFSYLGRERCNVNSLDNHTLSFSEELKEYHVEGTPCDFSIATSLSGICSPIHVEEEQIVLPSFGIESCRKSNEAEVFFKTEGTLLETPLMFSRCSSVSSLTSVEPADDVRSVISDYSRMASGMISPSDLPDSPTQTTVPSLHSFKSQAVQKLGSVFEEKVAVFREENTPVQFSTTSSLSALSFDENQLIEEESVGKLNDRSEATSEAGYTDGNDDEDILAACISAGMQNDKSSRGGNIKLGGCEGMKKTSEFSEPEKVANKISVLSPAVQNGVSGDVKLFSTESPSSNSDSTSYSDSPKLHEESDHNDILAKCIQAGMPKSWGRSKCGVKKSVKIPVKPSPLRNNCKPTCALHISNTSSTSKACPRCKMVKPQSSLAGRVEDVQDSGRSPLNTSSTCSPKYENKIQLSRRSSIESIKEDLAEDSVSLSELLLLEQCITSGMPKKKTR